MPVRPGPPAEVEEGNGAERHSLPQAARRDGAEAPGNSECSAGGRAVIPHFRVFARSPITPPLQYSTIPPPHPRSRSRKRRTNTRSAFRYFTTTNTFAM